MKRKDEPDDGQIRASQAQSTELPLFVEPEPTVAAAAARAHEAEPSQEGLGEDTRQAQSGELPLLLEPEPTVAAVAARAHEAEPSQEEHVAQVSDSHNETPSGDLGAGCSHWGRGEAAERGSASVEQDAEGKTVPSDKGAQALPAGVKGLGEDTQADGGGGQGLGKDSQADSLKMTQADSLKLTDAFEKTLGSLYSEATTMQQNENTPGGSDKTPTSQAVNEGGENAYSREDDDTTPPVMKGLEENVPEVSPQVMEKPPVAAAHQDQEQEQEHRDAVDTAKPHPYAANLFIKRTVGHEKPCLRYSASSSTKESAKNMERRKMQRKHTQRVRFYLPEEHMSAFSIPVWDPQVSVVPRAW